MPHAVSMPSPGFQALILCGPGLSLSTFTASPDELPKALIPIANRPMIWYPLDWCYRMGITDIHLVTPLSSAKAIEAALSQNPHLTSLPSPRPNILAPPDLSFDNRGTAEILRLPEVVSVIKGDFLILPCDLVCEVPGESLIEVWMIQQGGPGDTSIAIRDYSGSRMRVGDEHGGRRGGLGVWFQTKNESSTKNEETDFVITAPLEAPLVLPPTGSLRSDVSSLVYSITTDTLNDITEEKKSFPIRHGLLRKHGRIRILNTYRDAHIYLFPHWVLELVKRNENMDSISEDLVGVWAKATWQDGLSDKLGLREIFEGPDDGDDGSHDSGPAEDEFDVGSMSSTCISRLTKPTKLEDRSAKIGPASAFASRVSLPQHSYSTSPTSSLAIPPMLAYIQPTSSTAPLIRRVDTSHLLLSVSLYLAKLPSIDEVGRAATSPLAHTAKVAHPAGIAQRCTVTKADCLLAENVTVEEKCVIKESVIGANCHIKSGARLTRCVLMDSVIVGEKCQLTGCVLGRRAQVGRDSVLKECEVQDGNVVPDETDAKGQNFMVFEGLDEDGNVEQEMEEMDADQSTQTSNPF